MATGRLYCSYLQLLKSSTSHSYMQPGHTRKVPALLQLPENSKAAPGMQASAAVETSHNLWETHFSGRVVLLLFPEFSRMALQNPQVGHPVNKQLHGQRHQQQAHDAHEDANACLAHDFAHASRGRKHQVADHGSKRD
jgi:hypothetical protein